MKKKILIGLGILSLLFMLIGAYVIVKTRERRGVPPDIAPNGPPSKLA